MYNLSKKERLVCSTPYLIQVYKGDVAQMVERALSMREVQGSIPCFSIFAPVQAQPLL